VTAAAALAQAVLLVPATSLALMFALYTVAAHRPRWVAVITSGTVLVCVLVIVAVFDAQEYTVANAAAVAAVTALGDRTRVARERAVALQERARELEHEREERLRLAVTAERTRIARELHDITAHGVAVIAVQAAGARRVLATDPRRAAEALREIEETARGGLGELRQAVTLLREGTADGTVDGAADGAPQPGLAELPGLIERFRAAGLEIGAQLPDPVPRLGPAVGLTVYRFVQEALTNTLRHAGRTSARVRVDAGADDVRVSVHDDGPAGVPPPRTGPSGHGLLGLRERVLSGGGELTVLPGRDGYRLEARIPLRPPAAEPEPGIRDAAVRA
jgi:signal transduction histidine kinase